ncbi:hypothetical protein CSV69_15785 [Sporosarcina sp. P26b]|nr:hypothetical protein CSV69_15785 [Sporosarcina sp. P26b]
MLLKEMFLKNIERDIRGVIKVAQTSDRDIYQELDEYVVTQELHKHLSKFYDNYQKGIDGKTDKMGVWISGFFGSGKSHFLKILAYLLANQPVGGKRPIDFFEEKIQDPLVYANMKRTADVDTEVILFNIDSKSSLDNKSKDDAILRVFMKVFYEHRGYFGDIPGVAEMEKYLDKQGVYEAFQQEFEALAGEAWEDRRNSFYFDADFVISALTKVTDMSVGSARNWFENGVNNFEISIEKFAKDVKEYIDSKGPNFHLVFLVDEIGQYIGDNRGLMLNLQTLTEDLGTHTEGKVWMMVTSQESIDSIIKVKGDDFSRIQGRFDTRLSLSSISVDEVIKKRILEKHPHVSDKLKVLYHEKSAILKNLISFRGNTADLRGYEDETEFAEVYPFVPYQFKLLQNVFEQVRKHGSSGKHLSEGERSMLSAFKEAGLRYKDAEEGTLIPFYAFYDTIKEFLHPSISRVIERASTNPALEDDPFHAELLKVLFMIKYIRELPANMDNIATLMVTHVDEDKLQLKEKIKVSLRKLISQTLIQQNGEEHIFLTDDEQDINREIKHVIIDENIVKRELASYVFNDLYDTKRFVYLKNYSFPFNQKMDDKTYGNQTSAIGIRILTPLSDEYHRTDQELMLFSSAEDELVIKLGGNEAYTEEMAEALRIEEYRKKKNIPQLSENVQNILNNKLAEARERKARVRNLLEAAIKEGTYFINGNEADIKGSTVKEKMQNAFSQLVENTYTKLGDIKDTLQSEQELEVLLSATDSQITFDEEMKKDRNEQAKRELFKFIEMEEGKNKQVRVKIIYDRFTNKPYGWKQLDIAGLIVSLLKEQRIRIRYNTIELELSMDANQLMTVLTKTSESDRGIVMKRTKVDEKLIRTAKSICRDIFNTTDLADDEDGLIKDIRGLIGRQVEEIGRYKDQYQGRKYPGMSLLDKGLEYFAQFTNQLDNAAFFLKLSELEDDLADWEDDVAYVKSFFDTNQREIFDKGLSAGEIYEENKMYLTDPAVEQAMNRLQEIVANPIPYKSIKEIPELAYLLDEEMAAILKAKKQNALEKITEDKEQLTTAVKQYGVSDETKQKVKSYYARMEENLSAFTNIYKVDAAITQSRDFVKEASVDIQREIQKWMRRETDKTSTGGETSIPALVRKTSVKVNDLVDLTVLTSEEDVDRYVQQLSRKLKEMIHLNDEIEIIE